MLCVVRLCTSTPFASPVEVHLQQGDHLDCGPVMPFFADGMSADAEDGNVVVEVESVTC